MQAQGLGHLAEAMEGTFPPKFQRMTEELCEVSVTWLLQHAGVRMAAAIDQGAVRGGATRVACLRVVVAYATG